MLSLLYKMAEIYQLKYKFTKFSYKQYVYLCSFLHWMRLADL